VRVRTPPPPVSRRRHSPARNRNPSPHRPGSLRPGRLRATVPATRASQWPRPRPPLPRPSRPAAAAMPGRTSRTGPPGRTVSRGRTGGAGQPDPACRLPGPVARPASTLAYRPPGGRPASRLPGPRNAPRRPAGSNAPRGQRRLRGCWGPGRSTGSRARPPLPRWARPVWRALRQPGHPARQRRRRPGGRIGCPKPGRHRPGPSPGHRPGAPARPRPTQDAPRRARDAPRRLPGAARQARGAARPAHRWRHLDHPDHPGRGCQAAPQRQASLACHRPRGRTNRTTLPPGRRPGQSNRGDRK
jgi:hypothetical protein